MCGMLQYELVAVELTRKNTSAALCCLQTQANGKLPKLRTDVDKSQFYALASVHLWLQQCCYKLWKILSSLEMHSTIQFKSKSSRKNIWKKKQLKGKMQLFVCLIIIQYRMTCLHNTQYSQWFHWQILLANSRNEEMYLLQFSWLIPLF